MKSTVQITVNGERHEVPGRLSVTELIKLLGLKPEHVAVEVNKELVTRARHSEAVVANGDIVEVVTLVGGGGPLNDREHSANHWHAPGDEPAFCRDGQILHTRVDARLPRGQWCRGSHCRRTTRTAGSIARDAICSTISIREDTRSCPTPPAASRPKTLYERPGWVASSCSDWRILVPTGSSSRCWPIHEHSCPTRSPRWKRRVFSSRRGFRSSVIQVTTR